MSELEQLDRTIRLCRDYVAEGLSDEEICRAFSSLHVLCVSDRQNLSTHSGQTALVTLVSLLSRMGMQVELKVPDVRMLAPQPPLIGASVLEALIASSEAFVNGAAVHGYSEFRPNIVFVLGDTATKNYNIPCWRLSGGSWYGAISAQAASKLPVWKDEWAVGSMVSAALAANEAFKFVIRHLPLRDQSTQVFFEQSPCCSWDFGSILVPEEQIDLGDVDVISAGAITQAALYALVRFPCLRMRGRIFDEDTTAASNLNRNMLTLVTDIGSPKVQVVAQRCGTNVQLQPVNNRFVGGSFEGTLANRLLVGVDDIPSRWEIQRHARGWVGVSGTSHFNVSSSSHNPGEPCAGCLHPVDDPAGGNPIPTVSFVSFWAGLAMAVRLLRDVVAAPYSSRQQHLWLTPLRMDAPHSAMWLPVAPRSDCPVHCVASIGSIASMKSKRVSAGQS